MCYRIHTKNEIDLKLKFVIRGELKQMSLLDKLYLNILQQKIL